MRPAIRLTPWRHVRIQVRTYAAAPTGPAVRAIDHPAPHTGNIRVLLLDQPHNKNALSRRLCNELRQHIDEVKAKAGSNTTRALVIASNIDKVFCAGADLKERKTMSQAETTEFLDGVRDTFTDLQNLRIPTITAVDSFALGGGLEMALCTTLRVFGSSATVGLPETRLAIVPGAGGTFRLPAVIGLQRARDMILTGRRVTGAEAYFLGLCDRLIEVTPEEQKEEGKARAKVLDASLDLAREVCSGGPIAIGAAMDAVNGWQRGDAAMREAYDIILKTEDRMEALRAFGSHVDFMYHWTRSRLGAMCDAPILGVAIVSPQYLKNAAWNFYHNPSIQANDDACLNLQKLFWKEDGRGSPVCLNFN